MKWGYHHLRKHPYSNIGNIILGGFSSMISWLGLYDAIWRAILPFKQVVKKPPSWVVGSKKTTISVSDECWANRSVDFSKLPVFFPMVFFFAPSWALWVFSPCPSWLQTSRVGHHQKRHAKLFVWRWRREEALDLHAEDGVDGGKMLPWAAVII